MAEFKYLDTEYKMIFQLSIQDWPIAHFDDLKTVISDIVWIQ